jgi:hypothetical protein
MHRIVDISMYDSNGSTCLPAEAGRKAQEQGQGAKHLLRCPGMQCHFILRFENMQFEKFTCNCIVTGKNTSSSFCLMSQWRLLTMQ